jgi:hypothetical protein
MHLGPSVHIGREYVTRIPVPWSETTLNEWMMVERFPNLKEEVGGSIPDCEISSMHDGKLVKWSFVSRTLTLACRPFVSKKKYPSQLVCMVYRCGLEILPTL